ncbi:hypothetical protein RvY_10366 [Ramazzottius varieornatus]|uniref:Metalloendopeptidase n=1 Tax=Ramazzottius varieornatus TaxID=947166 RepID=A0A1D1VHV7_RAMVA|nr:hypothetical protein RvY_10366 [Ramazzottius varieornatus]
MKNFRSLLGGLVAAAVIFCAILCVLVKAAPSLPRGVREDPDDLVRNDLFEGDIVGVGLNLREFKTAEGLKRLQDHLTNGILVNRWPKGEIPFGASNTFSSDHQEAIKKAMLEITENTNIKFIKRTFQKDYVFIQKGDKDSGCYSSVGRVGGKQIINLEVPGPDQPLLSKCMTHGIIIHEITHAIGFFHEQARTDRDDYVDLNWDNIQTTQRHNFLKYDQSTTFGVPYDYDSILHYHRYSFAIDRSLWTIQPKVPMQDTPIGQREGYSPLDIKKINLMYPKIAT